MSVWAHTFFVVSVFRPDRDRAPECATPPLLLLLLLVCACVHRDGRVAWYSNKLNHIPHFNWTMGIDMLCRMAVIDTSAIPIRERTIILESEKDRDASNPMVLYAARVCVCTCSQYMRIHNLLGWEMCWLDDWPVRTGRSGRAGLASRQSHNHGY